MQYDINVTCEYENLDLAERACRIFRDEIPGLTSITIYTHRTEDKAYGYEYPPSPEINFTGRPAVGIIENNRFGGIPFVNMTDDRRFEPQYKDSAYVSVRAPLQFKDRITSIMTSTHGLKITAV